MDPKKIIRAMESKYLWKLLTIMLLYMTFIMTWRKQDKPFTSCCHPELPVPYLTSVCERKSCAAMIPSKYLHHVCSFLDVSADVSGTQFGHQRFWGYVSSFLWSHVKLRRCLWMWKGCHGLESKTHWIHPAMGLCFSATEISCLQLMQLMQIWMEAG